MPDIPQKQQNVVSLWRLQYCGIISSEHIYLSKFVQGQILRSKRNKMPYYDILTRPTTASQIAYFGNFRDGGKKVGGLLFWEENEAHQ